MAQFPQAPLPAIISIAPGALPADGPDVWEAQGLWTDITSDVRIQQGVQITGGRQDEGNQVDATKCVLTINNRSGNYSPRNPTGAYYGLLKKNTPLKVEVQRGLDTFNRTTSGSWGTSDTIGGSWTKVTSGSVTLATTPGAATMTFSAANALSGNRLLTAGGWNSDITIKCAINGVPTGAPVQMGGIVRALSDSSGFYMVSARFQTSGAVNAMIARRDALSGSIFTAANVLTSLTYTGSQVLMLRMRSAGPTIQGKLWWDGSSEPTSWSATFTEGNAALAYDTSSVQLGISVGVFSWREASNTGSPVFTFNSFRSKSSVFMGNVTEWPVRWDKSGKDSTAPITASGVLRRLGQGQSPLQSPLYKTLSTGGVYKPYAYWPLEDDSGAVTAVGIGKNVKPATVFSASFGFTGPPALSGATSTVSITQDTTISGTVPSFIMTPAAGWQMTMYVYTQALPPVGQDATFMQIRAGGTKVLWSLRFANNGSINLQTVEFDGTVGGTLTLGAGSFSAGVWNMVQIEAYQVASNVFCQLTSYNVTSGTVYGGGGADFGVGTVGIPNNWAVYGSATSFPTGAVGHVAFYPGGDAITESITLNAARGYSGETASARVKRLCTEQGVSAEVLDTSTTLMGPQRSDTFINLLRECEAADLGVLYETNYAPGLGFRSRPARYSEIVRVVLDFNAGNIAEPPEPTDDDQQMRNDWTVSRPNGSSARVTNETHIAAQGRYDDSTDINVSTDDVLIDHAGFRVYLGTYDELRWPEIQVSLAHDAGLIDNWLSTMIGSRVQVINPPAQLPGDPLDLIVEGYSQTLTPFGWDVELNCSPAEPWTSVLGLAAATLAATGDARIDSNTSTLGASATTVATSLTVNHPSTSAAWTNTDVPFDVKVTGEQMTVTAVSGTGTSQTWTVTRSVNAIVKAHSSGEIVALDVPTYAAL